MVKNILSITSNMEFGKAVSTSPVSLENRFTIRPKKIVIDLYYVRERKNWYDINCI